MGLLSRDQCNLYSIDWLQGLVSIHMAQILCTDNVGPRKAPPPIDEVLECPGKPPPDVHRQSPFYSRGIRFRLLFILGKLASESLVHWRMNTYPLDRTSLHRSFFSSILISTARRPSHTSMNCSPAWVTKSRACTPHLLSSL